MGKSEFEKYPDLARWMETLANSNIEGMSLAAWGDFCSVVDSALKEAASAPVEGHNEVQDE